MSSIESQYGVLPIFFYNEARHLGESLFLHLFEPRYVHMVERCLDPSTIAPLKFLYLPNFRNYVGQHGDVAMVAEVADASVTPDRTANIEASFRSYVLILKCWIEDSTSGLHYAYYKTFEDQVYPYALTGYGQPTATRLIRVLRQAHTEARNNSFGLVGHRHRRSSSLIQPLTDEGTRGSSIVNEGGHRENTDELEATLGMYRVRIAAAVYAESVMDPEHIIAFMNAGYMVEALEHREEWVRVAQGGTDICMYTRSCMHVWIFMHIYM